MARFAIWVLLVLAGASGASAQSFTRIDPGLFEARLDGLYGMAVVDVDGDGRTDILDGTGMHRQTATGFEFIPIGVEKGGGMLVADLDGDRRREIIKLDFETPMPYRYAPARGAVAAIPGTGIDGFTSSTLIQGSLLLDDDLDGQLDLFIGDDGPPDVLLRNDGGVFEDASDLLPRIDTGTYGAGAADFDNDGRLDIYIGLCREDDGGTQNVLYQRGADGYTSEAIATGIDDPNPSWGVAWLDYDNDGRLDVYVANMPSRGAVERPGLNTLYRNLDLSTFEDVAAAAGVAGPTSENSWSAVAADFDNDGWTDIFVANLPEPSRLWRNKGDGTFEDVTASAGMSDISTIVLAAGDVNGDGWIDLLTGYRAFLNDRGTNHWLRIQLRGTDSTPDGIGARVEVTAGGRTQIREITGGDGMMAQSHGLEAHVGLGDAIRADVTVRWPSGAVTELANVAADQLLTVVEGEGVNAPPRRFGLLSPAEAETYTSGSPVSLAWQAAYDTDPVTYSVHVSRPDGADTTFTSQTPTFELPADVTAEQGTYGWTVVADDGRTPRASSSRRTFTIGGPLASEPAAERAQVQIVASPNPARGRVQVQIEGTDAAGRLELLDARGRVLSALERASAAAASSFDLGGLPSGLYLVRFTPDEGPRAHATLVRTR